MKGRKIPYIRPLMEVEEMGSDDLFLESTIREEGQNTDGSGGGGDNYDFSDQSRSLSNSHSIWDEKW